MSVNKSGSEQWAEFSTWGLKNPGQYRDVIHHHEMTLSGDTFKLYMPPRSAQMWLAD